MRASALVALLILTASSCSAQPRWCKDKKFWTPFAISVGSMTLDYVSSQRAYAHGAIETNPMFGGVEQPSLAHMFAIGVPYEFGFAYSSYRLARSRHKALRLTSVAPVAYSTGLHIYWTEKNYAFKEPRSY